MFIRNAWYIAAEPSEVKEGIVDRTILGERLCLFRTESGRVAAFENKCPHRFAPLSLGRVVGEELECGYHGSRFDTLGRCVNVPGQDFAPSCTVRKYPLVERYGYIWVWMGDPEASSDESTLPQSFYASGDPKWWGGYAKFESCKCDYRLINDNLIDITHTEFVHRETLGGQWPRAYRKAIWGTEFIHGGMTFEVEDRSIRMRLYDKCMQPGGERGTELWGNVWAQSQGLPSWNKPIDFQLEIVWWAPGCTTFRNSIRPAGELSARPADLFNIHAVTPETERTAHYFYRSLRNFGDELASKTNDMEVGAVFAQDKIILEAQQMNVGATDLFEQSPKLFKGDALQLQMRSILKKMIEAETPTLSSVH